MKILTLKALLLFALAGISLVSRADTSVIEVGEAMLPAVTAVGTTATPFTTIEFDAAFPAGTTPNVFTMTPEFGTGTADDPCVIRIKNITNTGFDATCLEPRNEDRNSPATTFDYIAINSGITTIPTTTGGSVVFESACTDVNRQLFSNNCDGCTLGTGQVNGFQTLSFTTAFTNSPALLTEMVTTNNLLAAGAGIPVNEPEFISVAVDDLTKDDFGVSIERLEAGNGLLLSDEKICYLAVERDGCQTLDLSGINGSVASVTLEATSGGGVDGHDNGATTGEGATFTPACFSTTPVAVADMHSRNGIDGSVLRRESVSATEIILTADEDRISDPDRSHTTELVSAIAFSQSFTTPVTLNKVAIKQNGRRVKFEWQTTAESFHLGFHLWGETNLGWEPLNKRLIPGQGINTLRTSEYTKTLKLTRQQFNEIKRFGISSVDSSGFEEFYGPFEAGQEYGEENTSEAIDWAETRKQFERNMRDSGFIKVGATWRKNTKKNQRKIDRRNQRKQNSALDISFDGVGIRKILVADLISEKSSWRGKSVSSLAVTLNGQAVTREIVSDDAFLSDDDVVILNVIAPQSTDQIYIKNNNYRLMLDRRKAQDAHVFNGQDTDGMQLSDSGFTEQTLTQSKQYSRALSSGNPWYDSRILTTGGAVSKTYTAIFEQPVRNDAEAKIRFSLFGGIDLPGNTQDHHVQVKVNGTLIHDAYFDGFTEHNKTLSLPAGLLTGDNDEVTITLPGDTGLLADLVLIDEITLFAPTNLNSELATDFPSSDNAFAYTLAVKDVKLKRVFAYSDSGAFSLITPKIENKIVTFRALPFIQSTNKAEQLRYAVNTIDALESAVSIDAVTAPELHKQSTDLLVVAHPSFMGEALDAYINFKQDEGYKPLVVSWLDLVERYGFGNNTPNALNNFLSRAKQYHTPENMLIIGGHTYDYLDVLNTGVVNFIPTHYRPVSYAVYAPADNVFADLDGDNLPDMAIGRWPVRSVTDLQAIIAKSQAWQTKRKNTNNQNALLIAQPIDSRKLNFEDSLEGRIAPQIVALSQFSEPQRVYLQHLKSDGVLEPIAQARERISEAINSGTDLVSFAGHASASGWGYQGIVNTQLIQDLENHNDPIIVMPLACYTTDYQELSTNTLAHQWMFAGTQGAAAIHGSSFLGDYRENGIFAERFLKKSRSVTLLGKAIQQTKRRMSSANEMLHNWTLLGDPTLLLD